MLSCTPSTWISYMGDHISIWTHFIWVSGALQLSLRRKSSFAFNLAEGIGRESLRIELAFRTGKSQEIESKIQIWEGVNWINGSRDQL
jgi:hypothetical protein